jgi:hypothetical protein
MGAFWGNSAQHRGLLKITQAPASRIYTSGTEQRTVSETRQAESITVSYERTVTGALSQGFLINVGVFSSLFMMIGGMIIPGAAIRILEGTTCSMADLAALELEPNTWPSSVSTLMPFFSSCFQLGEREGELVL